MKRRMGVCGKLALGVLLFFPHPASSQDTEELSCSNLTLASEFEILLGCAGNGDPVSQTLLGFMSATGKGVTKDAAMAAAWYRRAAEQGYAYAQGNLGVMYDNGRGVPEDLVYAYMWFNLAAAQGNENASNNKEVIAKRMTREQIAEAQKLSREWLEQHPPSQRAVPR